jgi:hypothetical protein
MSSSPQPRLIHPIDVTFQIMDRDDSVFDQYAREPVGQVVREGESPNSGSEYTIKAQVSYYYAGARKDDPMWERGGVVEQTNCYVTVRYKDLVKVGLLTLTADGSLDTMILKRGDRVVKIGREVVDFYVDGFKPFGHYPNRRQTLLQVDLTDRHPGYQQGDL